MEEEMFKRDQRNSISYNITRTSVAKQGQRPFTHILCNIYTYIYIFSPQSWLSFISSLDREDKVEKSSNHELRHMTNGIIPNQVTKQVIKNTTS